MKKIIKLSSRSINYNGIEINHSLSERIFILQQNVSFVQRARRASTPSPQGEVTLDRSQMDKVSMIVVS